jgi:hypothetical protein
MNKSNLAGFAVAAAVFGFAAAAGAAPLGQTSGPAKGEVKGNMQPVDSRSYRHCHREDGERWCHGGEEEYEDDVPDVLEEGLRELPFLLRRGHRDHRGGDRDHHGGGGGGGGGGHDPAVESDIRLKKDIVLLKRLNNGIGLYRYRYKWSDQLYVGVMAQEVKTIVPSAVWRGRDGYLRVEYGQLGLRPMTWDQWVDRQ